MVIATDGRADDSLHRALRGSVKEIYAVGHCVSPRKMIKSVLDGALVGRPLWPGLRVEETLGRK